MRKATSEVMKKVEELGGMEEFLKMVDSVDMRALKENVEVRLFRGEEYVQQVDRIRLRNNHDSFIQGIHSYWAEVMKREKSTGLVL